jgi:predicted HTH domain antitoxin
MNTLTLNIPDNINLEDSEALKILAVGLYGKGTLSLGQAAEMVGVSKRSFIEVLGDYGVSVINYSPEELDEDIANASNHHS